MLPTSRQDTNEGGNSINTGQAHFRINLGLKLSYRLFHDELILRNMLVLMGNDYIFKIFGFYSMFLVDFIRYVLPIPKLHCFDHTDVHLDVNFTNSGRYSPRKDPSKQIPLHCPFHALYIGIQ